MRWSTAAHTLSSQVGDRLGQANALHGLGETAQVQGEDEQAHSYLIQAAELYEAVGLGDQAAEAHQRIPDT